MSEKRVKHEFTCTRCHRVEGVDSAPHVSRAEAMKFLERSCGWSAGECPCGAWEYQNGLYYNRRTGRYMTVTISA